MQRIKNIFKVLKKNKISFYTGVPDSILKNFSNELSKFDKKKHVITANEGGAIALAAGYYLATKKIPLVYFQNSGLGNAINPIISMTHQKIYGIPLIIFIGWRGAPSSKDEIQHSVQGKITLNQLKLLNINFKIFNSKKYPKQLNTLIRYSKKNNCPVAYLFKKDDLKNTQYIYNVSENKSYIKRSEFIEKLISKNVKSRIFATTGYTSRELFQLRNFSKKRDYGKDFYMVGGMGHTSSVSLGYSLKSSKQVICLDGDGSFLMHLGSNIISSKFGGKNFKYILLNNMSHESVGGQPTAIDQINIKKFALSIGYKNYFLIKNKNQVNLIIKKFLNSNGPSFLEVKIKKKALNNLLRIKDLKKIKKNFTK